MDANLYIDGFNLYYRALRRTAWRWLNSESLCYCSERTCSNQRIDASPSLRVISPTVRL